MKRLVGLYDGLTYTPAMPEAVRMIFGRQIGVAR